jgi:hypothetical protein
VASKSNEARAKMRYGALKLNDEEALAQRDRIKKEIEKQQQASALQPPAAAPEAPAAAPEGVPGGLPPAPFKGNQAP